MINKLSTLPKNETSTTSSAAPEPPTGQLWPYQVRIAPLQHAKRSFEEAGPLPTACKAPQKQSTQKCLNLNLEKDVNSLTDSSVFPVGRRTQSDVTFLSSAFLRLSHTKKPASHVRLIRSWHKLLLMQAGGTPKLQLTVWEHVNLSAGWLRL